MGRTSMFGHEDPDRARQRPIEALPRPPRTFLYAMCNVPVITSY